LRSSMATRTDSRRRIRRNKIICCPPNSRNIEHEAIGEV
jgi:hypothetical protein